MRFWLVLYFQIHRVQAAQCALPCAIQKWGKHICEVADLVRKKQKAGHLFQ